MTPQRALIEAAEEAKQILSDAGNSSFTDSIIEAMNILEAAISSAKAAEEGVETAEQAYLRGQEEMRDSACIKVTGANYKAPQAAIRSIQLNPYSAISVREKEGL
jgi:hypothetical protein